MGLHIILDNWYAVVLDTPVTCLACKSMHIEISHEEPHASKQSNPCSLRSL